MAGKFVFLIASLSVLAVGSKTDQILSNLFSSKCSKADASAVDEQLVIQVEPGLKKSVQRDLALSQKQDIVEPLRKTESFLDCSDVNIQGEKPSVYIGESSQVPSGIHVVKCSNEGVLEGLIFIHPYLASHLKGIQNSVIRPLISSLVYSNRSSFNFEIKESEICKGKNIDIATLTCDGRGRKQQLSLEEKYNILVGVGVPYAVNELAQDPLLTTEFYSQLVDNLFNYVFDEGTIYSSNTVTEYDEYEQVYYSMISLLSDSNRKNLHIAEDNLNRIITIAKSALFIRDPVRLLNDDSKVKILSLALLYSKHYDMKFDKTDISYIESVARVNNLINSIFSFLASEGRLNEQTSYSSYANDYGFKYENYPDNLNNYYYYYYQDWHSIYTFMRIGFGNSLGCTCNFCLSSKIILRIEINYEYFGSFSSMKSIQYFEIGELTDTSEYLYYPSPIQLSISEDGCFEINSYLKHAPINELRWECTVIPGITQGCEMKWLDPWGLSLRIFDFGLFTVQRVCDPTFGVNEAYPKVCNRGTCLKNCYCDYWNSICGWCHSPYVRDADGYCSLCSKGYVKNSEGKCVQCPKRCSRCDENQNCLDCENGYLLVNDKCEGCQYGYRKRYYYDDCVCDNGFGMKYEKNTCEPCSKGCECSQAGGCDRCSAAYKTNENGACILCNDGYGLSLDGQSCEPCGINCLCTESGKCEKCKQNYAKDSEFSCKNCAEGYAKDKKGECRICSSGFVLSPYSNVCQPCSKNCYCSQPNKCDMCLPGFTLVFEPFNQECKPCSQPNCYCNQEGTCYGCIEGFAFENGLCKPCQENCFCRLPGTCDSCIYGYTKDSEGNCNLCISGFGKDENQNCKTCKEGCECSKAYTCDRCQAGYGYNYNDECEPCTYYGCECSKNKDSCDSCREGFGIYEYYNYNNKCRECNERCTCKVAFTCDNCFERFLLEGSSCSKCNIQYNQNLPFFYHNCQFCADGYGYDSLKDKFGNVCKPCEKNCRCSWSNGCDGCLEGYKMDESKKCTLCSDGFARSESGDCKPCSKNCICQVPGQCDECLPRFKRDAKGFCNVCSENSYNSPDCYSCLPGYFRSSNGLCEPCQTGCRYCTISKECFDCLDGYFKDSERCEKCPNGCYCQSSSYCLYCLEGYGNNGNNECFPCLKNCYCSSPNGCNGCKVGYERDENNECLKCSTGYAKDSSGICQPCIFGCGCNVPNDCAYCLNNGNVVNDLNYCEPCPNGCPCTKAGVCDSCPSGYGFNNHHTCDPCLKNCLCSLAGQCDTCVGFFRKSSKGICDVCRDEYKDGGDGNCYQCNEGFGMKVDSNLCAACKPNCLCYIENECNSCVPGFYFNSNSGFCEPCELGCLCNSAFSCDGCRSGFTSVANLEGKIKCAECQKGCECAYAGSCDYCSIGYEMDENGSCSFCAPGYGLTENNECKPCKNNCLCKFAKECDSCKPGTGLDTVTGSCLACASNCLCSVHNTCERCLIGTFKSYTEGCQVNYCNNNRCICDMNFKCIKCLNNYANPQNNCNDCLEGFEREYYYDVACTKCKAGYFMDNQGMCRQCQLGCECNTNNRCLFCMSGYQSDGKGGCGKCADTSYPDSQGQCTLCKEGYYLSSNQCHQCNSLCACSSSYGCLYCLEGYGRDSYGNCLDCRSNCICSVAYTCLKCKEGFAYDPSNDNCVQCRLNCLCTNPGECDFCKNGYKMDGEGNCLICQFGFGLSGSECKPCRTGCTCQDAYSCSACLEGYTYDITANICRPCKLGCICSSSNNCESCIQGYFFDQSNKICSECNLNCECDESNRCLNCLGNSVMDENGNCVICKEGYTSDLTACDSCSTGFGRDSAGECVKCQDGCTCSYKGSCASCLPGFGMYHTGGCRKCKPNCNCVAADTCDSCFPGFYKAYSGECVPCPGNCECDQSGGCLKCSLGYYSTADNCIYCDIGYTSDGQGKCLKCEPGCQCSNPGECSSCIPGNLKDSDGKCSICRLGLLMDSQGRCLECPEGKTLFDLDGMVCIDCPENCETCEGIEPMCTKCKAGFGFDDKRVNCFPCLPNCLCEYGNMCDSCKKGYQIGPNSKCSSCAPGFYLNNNECQACQENCICDLLNKCLRCIDGTAFDENNQCKPCLENCLCDKADTCKSCVTGFTMQKGVCLPCLTNCICYIPYTCSSCLQGYSQQGNNGCTSCDIRHIYDPETNTCSKCAKGYKKNASGICSDCDDYYGYSGFTNYLGIVECLPCKIGCQCYNSDLYNPQCHYCNHNSRSDCQKCNTEYKSVNGWCNECADGYGLNTLGLCMPCASGCKCDHVGQCLSCLDGFARESEDSECLPCIANCLCESPGTCSSCQDGYTAISESECRKCDPGCVCDKYNSCTKCLDGYIPDASKRKCNPCSVGYFYDNSKSKCLPCLEGCLCGSTYMDRCYSCIAGYYYENQLICRKCSFEGCTCNFANECSGCLPGYGMVPDSTILKCLPCKENCFCTYFNQCSSCKEGFVMNSLGECQSCELGFSENLYYSGMNYRCEICRSGYTFDFFNSKKCIKCSENCECYDSNSQVGCDRCKAGSIFTGWIGDMLRCESCKKNCKCTYPGGCDVCLPGFEFNAFGDCICEAGFIWNPEQERCEPCAEGCFCQSSGKCDGCLLHHVRNALGECTRCEYPYTKGADQKCSVCVKGYAKNSEGECLACITGCSCKLPESCDECLWNEGYYLTTDSKCQKCDPNCLICDNEKCLTCESGYFQEFGNCFTCPLGCSACKKIESRIHCFECFNAVLSENDKCIECLEGFYKDLTGLCQPCSKGCLCSADQECLSCREGYLSDSSGGCSLCATGYGMNEDGTCTKCDQFCECSHGSSCNSCIPNHVFAFGNCLECAIGYSRDNQGYCSLCKEGFLLDSEGNCKDCIEGYILDNNKICRQCKKNCRCSQPYTCDSCIEGYEYSYNPNMNGEFCFMCSAGYAMNSNNECKPCLLNCQCVTPGKCDKCLEGFIQEKDGSCLNCKDGYAKDSKGSCKLCKYNCLCSVPDTCDKCIEGYKYNENMCSECAQGYGRAEFYPMKCLPCVPNCLCFFENRCDSCKVGYAGYLCANCDNGYALNGRICEPCLKNCYCDKPGECSKCMDRYQKDENKGCTRCADGFGKKNPEDICEFCLPNCICEEAFKCSGCLLGFVYIDNSCVPGNMYFDSKYIESFTFDEYLQSIHLVLTAQINPNLGTYCGQYFINFEILGNGNICQLKNAHTLVIILGNDWTISPSNGLSIRDSFLLINVKYSLFSSQDISPNFPPGLDINPHAVISGPNEVTVGCLSENVYLFSASSSYGVNSKKFSYEWRVSSESSFNLLSSDIIQVSLNLETAAFFEVTLTISNVIGSPSTVTSRVNVKNIKMITMVLDSGQYSVIKRSNSFTLTPVSVNYCNLFGLPTYEWTISPPISGIALDLSKLRVPSNSFSYGNYLISLKISLGNLQGTASSTIMVEPSELVASINKGNQEISSIIDFVVSGSASADPDGFVLTYEWFLDDTTISKSTNPNIVISKDLFAILKTFILRLDVSTSEASRKASTLVSLTVRQDIKITVSVVGKDAKAPISTMTNLKVAVVKDLNVVSLLYKWTQASGPTLGYSYLTGDSQSSFTIAKGVLIQGYSYSFKIVVTAKLNNGETGQVTTDKFFTANVLPSCSGGLLVTPNQGIQLKTKFTLSISGCKDGDLEDIPLTYKAYYYKAGKWALITTSKNSVISNLPLTLGVTDLAFDVCDTLGDCTNYPGTVIVKSSIRSLAQENLIEIYTEYALNHDPIFAIALILGGFEAHDQLLQLMWKDFEEYMNAEFYTTDALEVSLSSVSLFLNDIQNSVLKKKYATTYLNYVEARMKKTQALNSRSEVTILNIARLVFDLGEENWKVRAFSLLTALLEFNDIEVHEDHKLSSTEMFVFESENLIDYFESKEIDIFGNKLSIRDLNLPADALIKVEIIQISDYFSVQLQTSRTYSNGYFEDCDQKEIKIPKESVKLILLSSSSTKSECVEITDNLASDSCEITEKSKESLTVSIKSSGIFQITTEKPDKSTQTSSSASRFIGAFVVLLPLSLLSFILLPFLNLLRKKENDTNTDKTIIDNQTSFSGGQFKIPSSERRIVSQTIIGGEIQQENIQNNENKHYILRIIKSEPLGLFAYVLYSNFCLAIVLQGILLKWTEMNMLLVGPLSAIMVIPVSLILFYSRLSQYRLVPWMLVSFSIVVSTVASYFIGSSEGWYWAMLTGLLTELISFQVVCYISLRLQDK